jgi:hypothetical protein
VERELLGAVCGEREDGGVRGWAVWRAWDVGRRALLRQRGDRTMVDISGGNKAIGWMWQSMVCVLCYRDAVVMCRCCGCGWYVLIVVVVVLGSAGAAAWACGAALGVCENAGGA